ncbi:MAG: UDP-N-acetylmuramate dehydrogenase [Candidatus Gribaldobacteria bacterium]|nr:UDP-N-acetylmuramate dehydrogenase [Candidatus Gribaldobacteria bacterium]
MLKENILLKSYTTFQIGGLARYFWEAESVPDIKEAIEWAKGNGLSFFVLAGGSNLLVADKGFDGLAIKVQSSKFKAQSLGGDKALLYCEAGVKLSDLVAFSLEEGLSGLEWASGIPQATVGGSIWGNAGAFGKNMADIVSQVEVMEVQSSKFKVKNYKNKECGFAYKDSIFKQNKNLVILSAGLVLEKKNKQEVKEEVKKVLQYRKNHHPNQPSAGSVFQNIKDEKIILSRPEFAVFQARKEISAGWLIEQCGLKGKKIGGAQISTEHTNFIVNTGAATASEVRQLIDLAKQTVWQKFAIALEEEIQYLGF